MLVGGGQAGGGQAKPTSLPVPIQHSWDNFLGLLAIYYHSYLKYSSILEKERSGQNKMCF